MRLRYLERYNISMRPRKEMPMMHGRVRPRIQQPNLFEPRGQPVLRWDKIPEKVRQETLRLLTQLFRQGLQADSGVRVGKGVTDE